MTGQAEPTRVATATVMFTDLVDSTGIRVRLGEEESERLRRRHDRLVRAAVVAHSGRVAKHTGDGVMAVFDGAADAMSAAVAIQQDIDADNRQGTTEALRVRIGISAGDVTVDGDDCFGLPVVEAQRLEAAAQPAQILVSSLVSALARGRGGHELRGVGTLELKGLDAPVEAQEVMWVPRAPAAAALPARLAERGAFPFAGRTKQYELLSGAWSATASGATQLVLLSGEPGIGKTRLASELALGVADKGGEVLAGHCDELVGAPYQPFAEALRHHLAQPGAADTLGAAAGELARLVPELGQVVPGLAAPLSADPDAERLRLFEAVRAWLADLASRRPVMLVLDDLHWAEAGTLLLMRHLVVNEPVPQLLMLGTYRDTDLDRTHPLSGMLGELRRRPEVTRIPLDGLDAGEVTELMTQAAGHDLAEDGMALALAVQEETGGNPFFVGEVLRHLAESGAIVYSGGRWAAAGTDNDRLLPEGVREVVGRRVSRLGEATQQALSIAAVIGTEFGLEVLGAVSGRSDDDLIDALDPALDAHLITETGVGRYRFSHALARQTLHAELSTTRRARLHRSVAQSLESLYEHDLDAVTTELAYHWTEAGPATAQDQAMAYARRAGELAERRVAPEEAARWYGQARELLDGADPRIDAELATRIAQAMALGGLAGWKEAVHEAARAAEAVGDPALMAESLCTSRRTVLAEGSPEAADAEKIQLLERAIALCPDEDRMLWARLSGALAAELVYTGDFERRAALADAVESYAQSLEDPREWFTIIIGAGAARPHSQRSRSDLVRRLSNVERVAAMAAAEGDLASEVSARMAICTLHLALGNPEHRSALVDYGALLERYPHPFHLDYLVNRQMVQAVVDGMPAEVEACAGQLLRQGRAHGRGAEAQIYADSGLVQAARERFGLESLLDLLRASALYSEAKPNVIQAVITLALAEAGREAEARAVIDRRGSGGFADIPDDAALPVAESCWAEACALVGHHEACSIFYERMLRYAGLHQMTGGWYLGSTARYVGLLCDALGRAEEADAWFAQAAAEHVRIQSPPWLARGLLDWADSQQRRGRIEAARDLAAQALTAIGDLELTVTRSRAERILVGTP